MGRYWVAKLPNERNSSAKNLQLVNCKIPPPNHTFPTNSVLRSLLRYERKLKYVDSQV